MLKYFFFVGNELVSLNGVTSSPLCWDSSVNKIVYYDAFTVCIFLEIKFSHITTDVFPHNRLLTCSRLYRYPSVSVDASERHVCILILFASLFLDVLVKLLKFCISDTVSNVVF